MLLQIGAIDHYGQQYQDRIEMVNSSYGTVVRDFEREAKTR